MNMKGKPAWRNYILELILGIVLLPVYGIGIFFLIYPIYQRLSNSYLIENGRVENRKGIISRDISSINLKNLRSINLKQGIFQRIVGTGNLEFSSSGGGGVEVVFFGVKKPLYLKRKIEDFAEDHSNNLNP